MYCFSLSRGPLRAATNRKVQENTSPLYKKVRLKHVQCSEDKTTILNNIKRKRPGGLEQQIRENEAHSIERHSYRYTDSVSCWRAHAVECGV